MGKDVTQIAADFLDFVDVDFSEPRHIRKFSAFMPWGRHHMIGIRMLSETGRSNVMIGLGPDGPKTLDILNPGGKMGFLPAELPHHLTQDYGWWHINTTDEIYIPVTLKDGKIAFVIIEANFPDRYDRFVWYCRNCYSTLYDEEVNTGRAGIDGYWKAERNAVAEFNRGYHHRTCRDCGEMHPAAYSFFSPECEKTW